MFENWMVGLLTAGGTALAVYLVKSGANVLAEVCKKKRAEAVAADRQVMAVAFEGAERVLEAVTRATVGKLESNVAAELREKVKNGDAEYKDLCEVSEKAYREIIDQLKPEMQTVLLECIGDLETYIRNRVEAVLPGVKAEYAQAAATKQVADNIIKGKSANEEVATQA